MQLHALANARDQADILKSGSAAILSSKQTRALTFENLFLYFFASTWHDFACGSKLNSRQIF
jgi:hypothetical protein